MNKKQKVRSNRLIVDVVEYAFIEWLVRRGLYVAFRSNFSRVPMSRESFLDSLRDRIQLAYRHPQFGLGALVTMAFLFTSTPEGYDFWLKQSEDWKRFVSEFVKHS